MAHKRRGLTPFSLSFLDIMSCGFGAAVLLFLIIKHNIDNEAVADVETPDYQSEISLLEEEVLVGKENLVEIKNTIADIDEQLVITQGRARRITEEIDELSARSDEILQTQSDSDVESLKAELRQLEQRKNALQAKLDETGESARQFAGEGDRAYISGLKIGGKRILILVDSSASMLDKSIVNIIRRRNMSDEQKRKAPKWQHTIAISEWLVAKLPVDSQFQIYEFNTETQPLVANTKNRWLNVRDKAQLDTAVSKLKTTIPENGTNLADAFIAAAALSPKPDNIYLITDGLPTQGRRKSSKKNVSGSARLKHFEDALDKLPNGSPVNVILTPIEGDPFAPIAYWRLARSTQGSFLSPSEDWP